MHDPLLWYDELREETRLHWHEETRSWYVTRFSDVWEFLVDDRLGAKSSNTFLDMMSEADREITRPVLEFISKWPVFSDVPRHTTLHRALLPCFSGAETQRVTEAVAKFMAESDEITWDSGDLIDGILKPACSAGLGAFLGVEPSAMVQVSEWSARLIAFAGRTSYDHEIMTEANRALREFSEFVDQACSEGRSVLSRTVEEGLRAGDFDRADAVAVYGQMVTGFLQPTMSCLSMATELVVSDPHLKESFEKAPDAFITEAIRLASPFHFAPRRTLTSIDFAGQTVPAGERIVLLLVSANRDPRQFPDPLRFRLDRDNVLNVAFARGRYACLGAALARQLIGAVLSAVIGSSVVDDAGLVEWQIGPGMRMPLAFPRRQAADDAGRGAPGAQEPRR